MSHRQIRHFTFSAADYAAQAALRKAINPASPMTVEKLKFWDEWWDTQYRRAKFAVESAGQLVALGHYEEWIWWYEPGRYYVSLEVHPAFRRQGIGGELYVHLMDALAAEEPQGRIVMTRCREDQPETVRFLTQRGFQQTGSELFSELDVTTFDSQRLIAAQERMRQQGITIVAYPELAATDPACQRKCYELQGESMTGMPAGGERTRQSFAQFVQQIFANTAFIPAAFFIALDQGLYVGMSNLTNENDNPTRLVTDYTGVLPSHRRRGIATALKLHCLEYAKANGVKMITTSNDSTNPMYQLNLELGFKPTPAALYFELRQF